MYAFHDTMASSCSSSSPAPSFLALTSMAGLVFLLSLLQSPVELANADTFPEQFTITWGFDHVTTSSDGQALWLMLDNSSGSSFASKSSYLYGSVSMRMKLVPGDSAGVVTAYYMASPDPSTRDELDFEFLGNSSGEPYLLQTNVFASGVGGREQRIYLWFDPSEDFHSYSFVWNQQQIMFMVDDVAVRVFLNNEARGVPYLRSQAMGIFSSIWNGDQWATQGGRVKTNWTHAPFVSSYRDFNIDACEWSTSTAAAASSSAAGGSSAAGATYCDQLPESRKWWSRPPYTSVQPRDAANLRRVKERLMVYDYCTDGARYNPAPAECSLNP